MPQSLLRPPFSPVMYVGARSKVLQTVMFRSLDKLMRRGSDLLLHSEDTSMMVLQPSNYNKTTALLQFVEDLAEY